ncbi:hypothetical protein GCK32_007676 [Trichostrongylus colubriformis]|uniref:Nuclear pore complex protein Nup85 n=1 Tax=Trichostrongylus colubriformis TaxID=6319 RepID=A0AAN8FPA8_TRICO
MSDPRWFPEWTFFSLWEVGADYLLHCGSEGRLRLENHIEEIYIQDDEMAENLMRICIEQELDDSKACIVNTMTYRYLRDGEWSAALSWALRGGRGAALDTTVNDLLTTVVHLLFVGLVVLIQCGGKKKPEGGTVSGAAPPAAAAGDKKEGEGEKKEE